MARNLWKINSKEANFCHMVGGGVDRAANSSDNMNQWINGSVRGRIGSREGKSAEWIRNVIIQYTGSHREGEEEVRCRLRRVTSSLVVVVVLNYGLFRVAMC